jgi:kojibiose phosphorylase
MRIAIASASKNARTVVERLDVDGHVDAISDGYSVDRQKPAPDLFLHAAGQLGISPQRCVVIEDAASGVAAGLAAGMRTVGIGPDERVGEADIVLASLKGVSWSDLRGRLPM